VHVQRESLTVLRTLHPASDLPLDREAEGLAFILGETDAIREENELRFQRFLGSFDPFQESLAGHHSSGCTSLRESVIKDGLTLNALCLPFVFLEEIPSLTTADAFDRGR